MALNSITVNYNAYAVKYYKIDGIKQNPVLSNFLGAIHEKIMIPLINRSITDNMQVNVNVF